MGNPCLFNLKASPGVFTVPANMLRCKIDLARQNKRSLRPVPIEQVVWEVTVEQHEGIKFTIEHEFKDEEDQDPHIC